MHLSHCHQVMSPVMHLSFHSAAILWLQIMILVMTISHNLPYCYFAVQGGGAYLMFHSEGILAGAMKHGPLALYAAPTSYVDCLLLYFACRLVASSPSLICPSCNWLLVCSARRWR
jgi:hypothetical protein